MRKDVHGSRSIQPMREKSRVRTPWSPAGPEPVPVDMAYPAQDAVSDVSCRAFAFFRAAADRGLIDLDELVDGFALTRAELEDPGRRVDWATWTRLLDRYAELLGGPDAVELSAGEVLTPDFRGPISGLVPVVAGPRELLWLGLRWFGPSMYRNLYFEHRELPSGRIHIVVEIPPRDRGCEAWLAQSRGVVRFVPQLLGLPEAVVTGEHDDHRLDITVALPPSRGPRVQLRRMWRAFRGSRALLDELTDQQNQVNATYTALAQAERGFRAALDTLPTAVGILRQGRLMHLNRRLGALLPDEVSGQRLLDHVGPASRERAAALVERCDGEPREITLRGREGEEVPVEAGFVGGFAFDGHPAVLFFATDLRERREAAAELERSEQTRRLLLEALPDAVIRFAADGRMLDLKPGRDLPDPAVLEQFIGQPITFMAGVPGVGAELVEQGMGALRRAFESRTIQSIEFETGLFGEPRQYDVRVLPLDEREALAIVRDISDRRRMERQLAVTERMASLGTVAAGVAHEVNNPLTFVAANLELAIEDLRGAMEHGQTIDLQELLTSLEEAREGAGRVRQIVNDLRLFSRASGGPSAPVDVDRVVASALKMTRSELLPRVVVTPVLADRNKLTQVLVNLLTNAAQAMPEARPRDENRLRVRASETDDRVLIQVEDNGVGIDGAELDRIFEPFFTTKHRRGGTGLGLSICQRLVQEMDGDLSVESERGRGSCFTIELPRATEAPAEATDSGHLPALAVGGRVLIIDDEPLVARALARTLDAHHVEVVRSGAEALARLSAEPFEVILCDLMMPGMTGPELFTAATTSDPSLADRFLFVTGGAVDGAMRRFFDEHQRRCLTKPVAPDELRMRVARQVARLRAAAPA